MSPSAHQWVGFHSAASSLSNDGNQPSAVAAAATKAAPQINDGQHQKVTQYQSPKGHQLACLYSKHKTQKRKIWNDGRLVIQATQASLHDAHPPPGSGDPVLDQCEISRNQCHALMGGMENRLETDKFLIQVDGPWKPTSQAPATVNSNPLVSQGMQKVKARKFRRPGPYVPRNPMHERQYQVAPVWAKRQRPLQPSELHRRYYGTQQQAPPPPPQAHEGWNQAPNGSMGINQQPMGGRSVNFQPKFTERYDQNHQGGQGPTEMDHGNAEQSSFPSGQGERERSKGAKTGTHWTRSTVSSLVPPNALKPNLATVPPHRTSPNIPTRHQATTTLPTDPPQDTPVFQASQTPSPFALTSISCPSNSGTPKTSIFVQNRFNPSSFYGEEEEELSEGDDNDDSECENDGWDPTPTSGPQKEGLKQDVNGSGCRNEGAGGRADPLSHNTNVPREPTFPRQNDVAGVENGTSAALSRNELLKLFGAPPVPSAAAQSDDSTENPSTETQHPARPQTTGVTNEEASSKQQATEDAPTKFEFILPDAADSSSDEDEEFLHRGDG